uniref:Uncharacterized protein n=1 Tax=Eptatretus burgeri TaxID=7764 RepID=A0A8C4QUW0_EPTBU
MFTISLAGGELFSIAHLAAMPGARQARPGSQPVTLHIPGSRLAQLQQRLSLPGTACVSKATPRGRHPHDAGNLVLLRQPGPVALVQTMASTPPGQTVSGHPASIASTILLTSGTSQHAAMPEETKLILDENEMANAEKLGSTRTSFQKLCPLDARLDLIIQTNERRCTRAPVYGCDLRQACLSATLVPEMSCCSHSDDCFGQHSLLPWQLEGLSGSHGALKLAVLGMEQRLKRVWDEMGRNILVFMPAVTSFPPCMDASHPVSHAPLEEQFCQSLKSGTTFLHHHSFQNCLQLPDPSSILAQSGKLQTLVFLLDQLKKQHRRLLLLSHSEKVLDLIERFFAHWRLPYARVEGNSTTNTRRVGVPYKACLALLNTFAAVIKLCSVWCDGLRAVVLNLFTMVGCTCRSHCVMRAEPTQPTSSVSINKKLYLSPHPLLPTLLLFSGFLLAKCSSEWPSILDPIVDCSASCVQHGPAIMFFHTRWGRWRCCVGRVSGMGSLHELLVISIVGLPSCKTSPCTGW